MSLVTFPQVPAFSGRRARWPEGLGQLRNQAADDLMARARRLWPDGELHAEHNRTEWLRAVGVVRRTAGGWLLERKVARHG